MALFFWTKADYAAVMNLLTGILASQQKTETAINKILNQEKNVMSAIDDLTAQVHANTDLEQSAVSAIKGIAEQLRVALANDDSAALQQLSQQLTSSAQSLGEAIAANTPHVEPLSTRRK